VRWTQEIGDACLDPSGNNALADEPIDSLWFVHCIYEEDGKTWAHLQRDFMTTRSLPIDLLGADDAE
jgi:hypothetical protein